MKTKMKIALGFGIGVGVGVGGTVVAQKCYEKYQNKLVEEFIDADIDDTVSGWDSEDEFDDDDVLEETSEDSEEESAEEEDAPINITDDYVVPHPPIRLTCDRQDHDDDQLPEEETEETSSEEEVSEHADIINFVTNGGAGDEKDSEDLSEDAPVEREPDDSKGSEPDDPIMVITSNNSVEPKEFSPEFVEMVQNSMDRVEEIYFLLDEKRYQEAKKLYRTTLVPLIANDTFREKYPDGTKVIESIGDKITDTICSARRAAKKKAKEEKAARRNANKYANQRRNSSSMVQPMKQYNRRAR